MKSKRRFVTVITALAGVGVFSCSLEARTCAGDGMVIGSYAFTSARGGFFLLDATAAAAGSPAGSGPLIPVSITPPGSNPTTAPATTPFIGSGTSIGSLIAGLNNPSVLSGVGQLSADGNGNFFASPGTGLPANVPAGTYNVNVDCSITATLWDPFTGSPSTTSTLSGTTTVTTVVGAMQSGLKAGSVNLQGELLNNGGEIDMAVAGASGAGVTVKLAKTSQANACTNASLSNNWAITGNGFYSSSAGSGLVTNTNTTAGVGTTTGTTTSALPSPATTCTTAAGTITTTTTLNGTTTTGTATNCIIPQAGAFLSGATGSFGTPFNLLGRFVADGNGNLVNDNAGVQSPLTASITGTYTVNSDCTGSAKLIDQANISRNINFVIGNNSAQCSTTTGAQNTCVQQLQFVFSDPGVFGSGTATQQ